MAKVKSSTSETPAVDNIFKKLISGANKIVPNATMIASEMDSEITTWVDSGSLLLNMILSNKPDGGWPCGRIVQVFGQESIGKSTLAYVAIAQCQRAGGICIYADIENAANKQFMSMLGVNLNELIWTNVPDIEDLFAILEDSLKTIMATPEYKGKPVLVIVDSIAVLQTKLELEGTYEANMNVSLGKAKQLHKALRKIVYYLNKANSCLFCIDQIKDNATGQGVSWAISGGKALPFFSSIRVFLQAKQRLVAKDKTLEAEYEQTLLEWKQAGGLKSKIPKPDKPKVETVTIGYEVTAYTIKNKTAPPDRSAKFRIIFAEGLDDAECYFDYLVKFGAAKTSGAWSQITGWENDYGSFYKSDFVEKVLSDYEAYTKVREFLIDKMTIKTRSNANYIISEEAIDKDEAETLKKLKEEYVEEEIEENEE